MTENRKFIGIILYTGEAIVPFGESMYAVPIKHLWNAIRSRSSELIARKDITLDIDATLSASKNRQAHRTYKKRQHISGQ